MVVLGSGWRTAFHLIPHRFTENHVLLSQQAPFPAAILALADGTSELVELGRLLIRLLSHAGNSSSPL